MVFYNRQEEVLEIELTSYGRHLLSKGRFKPVYYSFFDDDIIYDSKYMGYDESQSAAEDRIKETPRPKIQKTFRNCREEFDTSVLAQETDEQSTIQSYYIRNYSLSSELGIADYYSDNSPAFDVNILRGELSDSPMLFTSSIRVGDTYEGPKFKIPQLNVKDLVYETVYGALTSPEVVFDEEERFVYDLEDGFLELRDNFLLVEIDEVNSPYQKENFKIELFEVSEEFPDFGGKHPSAGISNNNSATRLKPIKFWNSDPNKSEEMDFFESEDFDLDHNPIPKRRYFDKLNRKVAEYADYYLSVKVDDEISERFLCKYKGLDTAKGLFLDRVYDCGDEREPTRTMASDMYARRDVDVGEVCD